MPQANDPSDPRVAFGDALVRVMKIMAAVKQRAPRAHPDVDPMGYPLMFNLSDEPRRVSDIAAALHLDVSTVSRQVSQLVGQTRSELQGQAATQQTRAASGLRELSDQLSQMARSAEQDGMARGLVDDVARRAGDAAWGSR